MLPRLSKARKATALGSATRSALVRMMTGTSDHAGCARSAPVSPPGTPGISTSSVMTMAPTPDAMAVASASAVSNATASRPLWAMNVVMTAASRPSGATTRTRSSRLARGSIVGPARVELRDPGHDSSEMPQGLTDADPRARDLELPDARLVGARPPLHHRDGLADGSFGLEEAQQEHAIGQIAHVDGGEHLLPHHAVLAHDADRQHAALPKVAEQLVQVQGEQPLLRHGVEVAVQAVDHHHPGVVALDALPNAGHEFSGRQLGRVHLLDAKPACPPEAFHIETHAARAAKIGIE